MGAPFSVYAKREVRTKLHAPNVGFTGHVWHAIGRLHADTVLVKRGYRCFCKSARTGAISAGQS